MRARETESGALTGRRISEAVVTEMTAGAEPLARSVLVPSVFRVYLHPDDWERLSPILQEIRNETESVLAEALARLNKPLASWTKRLGLRTPKEHRRVKDFWQVDFYPNNDEDATTGEFVIFSDFPEPPRATELEGSETVRATRYGTSAGTGEKTRQSVEAAGKAENVLAQFRFTDELGRRSYLMTRNQVHIGRGGLGRWVDLELHTEIPDISREHAIVRRRADGAFEIKDVSKFGTTVDGVAVPQSRVTENGAEVDKDVWSPVAAGAHIVLAGKMELDFEPVPQQ
ncbi:MAG TPA: FhaA domain-containing protein [Bryobacteraceae bacterium]|nr:FhaA domain-containing protein [Bryobacteraceae bacterium]